MATLYFEASDEDNLQKAGFSRGGKNQFPQIFLGFLVGLVLYTIGYDIYEGHTLIPFIEKMAATFNLDKPMLVADSGLVSKEIIIAMNEKHHEYIIGAKLKSEPKKNKQQILDKKLIDSK